MQVMTLIFTTIGSAADYGTFGRWLLLTLTVICWGAQYASLSLTGGYSSALFLPPSDDPPSVRPLTMGYRHGTLHDQFYHLRCDACFLHGSVPTTGS